MEGKIHSPVGRFAERAKKLTFLPCFAMTASMAWIVTRTMCCRSCIDVDAVVLCSRSMGCSMTCIALNCKVKTTAAIISE